ncbi:MAG: hypothetical protein J6K89_02555 [Oscillospiraceae bacterium]|nr:hypothetical protein [Oscillospiraceae bacterium]
MMNRAYERENSLGYESGKSMIAGSVCRFADGKLGSACPTEGAVFLL